MGGVFQPFWRCERSKANRKRHEVSRHGRLETAQLQPTDGAARCFRLPSRGRMIAGVFSLAFVFVPATAAANWPTYLHDVTHTSKASSSSITPQNVSTLLQAWRWHQTLRP